MSPRGRSSVGGDGQSEQSEQTLGDRVRRRRLELGLTQQALADAAGVTREHVVQIEGKRRRRMRIETLARYARALGVPPAELEYGDPGEWGASLNDPERAEVVWRASASLKVQDQRTWERLRRALRDLSLDDEAIEHVESVVRAFRAEDQLARLPETRRGDTARDH